MLSANKSVPDVSGLRLDGSHTPAKRAIAPLPGMPLGKAIGHTLKR